MFGKPLRHFESVSSTNDLAMQWARDGASHGALVRADTQTSGRGRQGRIWSSPPGLGLYLSLVLRPSMAIEQVPHLTMLAALATAQTVETVCGVRCHTKWPNDIILHNRKIGGVLSEAKSSEAKSSEAKSEFGNALQVASLEASSRSQVEFVVVGVGLNVNFKIGDLPVNALIAASSLLIETGRAWSPDELLDTQMAAFESVYGRYERGAWDELRREFERRDVLQNRAVRVESGAQSYRGVVEGIDASGVLIVRGESGARRVVAGDVRLESAFDDESG